MNWVRRRPRVNLFRFGRGRGGVLVEFLFHADRPNLSAATCLVPAGDHHGESLARNESHDGAVFIDKIFARPEAVAYDRPSFRDLLFQNPWLRIQQLLDTTGPRFLFRVQKLRFQVSAVRYLCADIRRVHCKSGGLAVVEAVFVATAVQIVPLLETVELRRQFIDLHLLGRWFRCGLDCCVEEVLQTLEDLGGLADVVLLVRVLIWMDAELQRLERLVARRFVGAALDS
mmetsp:Transcript_27790/g.70191  ORF Transcript_27790/g.70191 Transcript_27790/m.70191 type:complete len:229 (-) Transcript_27790:239-925(-)